MMLKRKKMMELRKIMMLGLKKMMLEQFSLLNSKIVIEQEDIIIDNLLSSKNFYVYNEFLKTSPIFKSLFSDDGYLKFEMLLSTF